MSSRSIEAASVSEGWIGACRALLACGEVANHLVVRMVSPLPENEQVRADAEAFLSAAGHQEIDEVRNTIFPAAVAHDFPEPAELVDEYLEDYDVIRALGSRQGTYFGRMCAYPHPKGAPTPQLTSLVDKLRGSHAGTRWRAVYQLNIYAEHKDRGKKRGFFPCMAHLGFQLGGDRDRPEHLDCVALYRFQDMVLKGYGNLLGLAQLQEYLAATTGFSPGELTVVAGHAELTLDAASRAQLKRLVSAHT